MVGGNVESTMQDNLSSTFMDNLFPLDLRKAKVEEFVHLKQGKMMVKE